MISYSVLFIKANPRRTETLSLLGHHCVHVAERTEEKMRIHTYHFLQWKLNVIRISVMNYTLYNEREKEYFQSTFDKKNFNNRKKGMYSAYSVLVCVPVRAKPTTGLMSACPQAGIKYHQISLGWPVVNMSNPPAYMLFIPFLLF